MARGKYSEVVRDLPNLPAEDASYQDRVNVRKAEIVKQMTCTASSLAHRYRELRAEEEVLKQKEKDLNFEMAAVTQLLIDQYENEGTTSVRLDDGSAVSVTQEPYSSVFDRDAFRDWCIENGYGRQLMLPWQTTNSIVKGRLLNGEPEPPGVKAYNRRAPRFQKG